jgi:hypothetical protein
MGDTDVAVVVPDAAPGMDDTDVAVAAERGEAVDQDGNHDMWLRPDDEIVVLAHFPGIKTATLP